MSEQEQAVVETIVIVEWRVESDTTEDEFGTDERRARDWFAHCQANPDWEPCELLTRTVTTAITAWSAATPDQAASDGSKS